jgi:FkbM family methyltransferase
VATRLRRVLREVKRLRQLTPQLGFIPAVIYLAQRRREHKKQHSGPYKLYSKEAAYPLQCRPGTSDRKVFEEIYIARAYQELDSVNDTRLIIDCGANVGYASAYFLSRFPQAHVIAIEPDPDNFALLTTNLAPYQGRYWARCAAVWSHATGLVLSETPYRDGQAWARQVRPAQAHEPPTIVATDIGTVLAESGFERISILKVDIERAEAVVFAENYAHWLEKVDNLVIELHDEECQAIFLNAIAAENFVVSQAKGLTICKRLLSFCIFFVLYWCEIAYELELLPWWR